MIKRLLSKAIANTYTDKKGFIAVIYGPRRVGKTVLLKALTQDIEEQKLLWLNGDTSETQVILSETSQASLSKLVAQKDVIVVDEAQRIKNIGLSLKILIDTFPEKKFFVSGSSSLELSKGIHEPLTGRTIKYKLYPLSTQEMTYELVDFQKATLLPQQLRFGGYPYLTSLSLDSEKREYLISILEDYLFRDIEILKDRLAPELLRKLATLLSYQVGQEVSLNELANNLGRDIKTIERYLYLLKEAFIIFELGSFSRNLRKEISKGKKYYFWDLGIRNALIDQFGELETRVDVGALWENFCAVERIKKHEYAREKAHYYFWRTYEKAEIDWIEEQEGKMQAYEFKWSAKKEKTPKAFFENYHTTVKYVTRENYLEFVV